MATPEAGAQFGCVVFLSMVNSLSLLLTVFPLTEVAAVWLAEGTL